MGWGRISACLLEWLRGGILPASAVGDYPVYHLAAEECRCLGSHVRCSAPAGVITVYVLTAQPILCVPIRLDLQVGPLGRQAVDLIDLGFTAIIPASLSTGLQGGYECGKSKMGWGGN